MRKIFTIAILALSINAFAQTPTNGLIGYWTFSGNANDLSGNNYNGTVNGATLTTDRFGNPNSAYSFDGISNYISTANINLHDTATISAWVYPLFAGSSSRGGAIVDKNMDANTNSGYVLIYNNFAGNGLYAHVGWSGDTNNTIISHNNLSLSQWHHCVLTLNNGTAKLYLDGSLICTKTSMNSTTQNTATLLFGKSVWGGNLFSGKLDDIRIYNRPLNSLEVTALYNENTCNQLISDTTIKGAAIRLLQADTTNKGLIIASLNSSLANANASIASLNLRHISDSISLTNANSTITLLNSKHLSDSIALVNKHDTVYTVSSITSDTLKISIHTGISITSPTINLLKVYPNPTSTILHIDLASPGYFTAKLSGVTGQSIITPTSGTIDISALANGIYILTIYDSNGKLISTNKISIAK